MPGLSGSTILLVEDETLVRMQGVDVLEEAGFTVLEAANADEALQLLEQHDDVELLFSDIDMPGSMDGLALARLVHEKWPAIHLLLTSGYHRVSEARIPENGRFVSKPWQEKALVGEITALLQR